MIRLLDACVKVLKKQGMTQLFLDGVKSGYDGFLSIGELIPCLGSKLDANVTCHQASTNGQDIEIYGRKYDRQFQYNPGQYHGLRPAS